MKEMKDLYFWPDEEYGGHDIYYGNAGCCVWTQAGDNLEDNLNNNPAFDIFIDNERHIIKTSSNGLHNSVVIKLTNSNHRSITRKLHKMLEEDYSQYKRQEQFVLKDLD